MGSDACISLFDQQHWDDVLIPSAIGVITGHGVPDWATAAIKKIRYGDGDLKFPYWDEDELKLPRVKSFQKDCTVMVDMATIDAGLYSGKIDDVKPRTFWDVSGELRVCQHKACNSWSRCPFSSINEEGTWEDTSFVFSQMVEAVLCPELKDGFMGRNTSSHMFLKLLDERKVPPNANVRDLLDRLGSRGFFIGYMFSSSGEGIDGWLTSEECHSLATELRQLDIPQFEATKDELIKMRPNSVEFKKLYRQAEYNFEIREKQWRILTLAYLCAFAEYAALSNKGVIWINH